jgi:tetrachlorobenzoquinone reductase
MAVLRVASVAEAARGVRALELVDPGGGVLPAWEPGAHVDLVLPGGVIRQYSLCSDPADRTRYRIAVLRVDPPAGRGGSCRIHDELAVGDLVEVGEPRNHFALEPAEEYLLLAGGIGITPLLAMARELARRDARWRLVYGARSRQHVAFLEELAAIGGDRVTVVCEDEAGFIEPAPLLAAYPGATVYCCGPEPMLAAVTAACAGRALRLERFVASEPVAPPDAGGDRPFLVELARTGGRVEVGADQTILEALRGAGLDPPCSCEQGICGTCETRVIAGAVDHRDTLLTDAEHAAGETMMLCVSRAAGDLLVLDC